MPSVPPDSAEPAPPAATRTSANEPEPAPSAGTNQLLLLALLIVVLYGFFVGLDLMGLAFKLFGRGFAEQLIARTANPFTGLFIGILATSVIQSSSTTTSMTVALVAGGGLTVTGAIPIIMGANIGTSVTNTIVSLGHVSRREEFRRAFAGATVHDFFNWLTVLVLFPLELVTGYLSRSAHLFEHLLADVGVEGLADPLKMVVRPTSEWIAGLLGDSGGLVLVAGLLFLFLALRYLVKVLRQLLSRRAEELLHRTLFRSPPVAILAGTVMTVMVQSSSITTSVIVPLAGAGVVSLVQLFPFTVGANIGTTVTAIIASLATGKPEAITIALCHLLFNITGMLIIYVPPPVRRLPLFLAQSLGDLASRNRLLAGVYILTAFFGVPLLLLFLTGALRSP